jgi:hypothetical protein
LVTLAWVLISAIGLIDPGVSGSSAPLDDKVNAWVMAATSQLSPRSHQII